MDSSDLEKLRRIRLRCERLIGGPSLFHMTRIRLDGSPCDRRQVRSGWKTFRPLVRPFGFATVETRAGPDAQQSCYIGSRNRLDEYTGLAAAIIGNLTINDVPIVYSKRNPRFDRDQWTLHLYDAAVGDEFSIAVDTKGDGEYALYGLERHDTLMCIRGIDDEVQLHERLQGVRAMLRDRGLSPPTYIYGSIATDVFMASLHAVDAFIRDVEAGKLASITRLPGKRKLPLVHPAVAALADNETEDAWPPDEGWHFRPAVFAYRRRIGTIKGKPWALLQFLSQARRPRSESEIMDGVWGPDGRSGSTVRTTISFVRASLRKTFCLSSDIDPIPAADRGGQAAWALNDSVLIPPQENKNPTNL
jgi:hypothetical protein